MNLSQTVLRTSLFLLLTLLLAVTASAQTQLVRVTDLASDSVVDLRYATDQNVFKKRYYESAEAFLVKPAAEGVASANALLRAQGLRLKIWDAYRPLHVQQELWKAFPDPNFVADPKVGSRHNRGTSVDVTLVDPQGHEVVMPTEFDDFSAKAAAHHPDALPEARKNREILQKAMTESGFLVLESEWWHFDFADWARFPLLDIDSSRLGTSTPAMVPVH